MSGLAAGPSSAYLSGVGWLIDSRRRWFGLCFLLLALGMLVWGQTWLRPHLRGWAFVVYWMVCLGCTLLALLTALVDAWVTRRQWRRRQADLLRETLEDPTSVERRKVDRGRSEEGPRRQSD